MQCACDDEWEDYDDGYDDDDDVDDSEEGDDHDDDGAGKQWLFIKTHSRLHGVTSRFYNAFPAGSTVSAFLDCFRIASDHLSLPRRPYHYSLHHMRVSQISVYQKWAERYRPPPSILVVFHTFLSVTPMTHTFWEWLIFMLTLACCSQEGASIFLPFIRHSSWYVAPSAPSSVFMLTSGTSSYLSLTCAGTVPPLHVFCHVLVPLTYLCRYLPFHVFVVTGRAASMLLNFKTCYRRD